MIIAIDAASTDLSVAIANADGSSIDEVAWTSEQRQSAELLPRLLELLETNGRSLHDAAAVATGTGPGSFTGLRVAMALAKASRSASGVRSSASRAWPPGSLPSPMPWLRSLGPARAKHIC
jgi:tRNA threonylcarbamoyladenosine biosynthesis protein TsaB